MNSEFKLAVTVAEMARMAGLSRSRFYQLIGSAFPEPCRDEAGRPYYSSEQQQVVLEVRRRNCGIDGKPILFYAPRSTAPLKRPGKSKASLPEVGVLEGVRALGLTAVSAAQVAQAIKESYPSGTEGIDSGEVIRTVFLSVKRQNSSDKVGR